MADVCKFVSGCFKLVICHALGHAHLTDFNIATIIKDGERATALAGTKPYMGTEASVNYLCNRFSFECSEFFLLYGDNLLNCVNNI